MLFKAAKKDTGENAKWMRRDNGGQRGGGIKQHGDGDLVNSASAKRARKSY